MAPSHYLNQNWNIVNWAPGNKLQRNLNRNLYTYSFKKMLLEMSSGDFPGGGGGGGGGIPALEINQYSQPSPITQRQWLPLSFILLWRHVYSDVYQITQNSTVCSTTFFNLTNNTSSEFYIIELGAWNRIVSPHKGPVRRELSVNGHIS